jgi:hypothetical protein
LLELLDLRSLDNQFECNLLKIREQLV